MCQYLGFILFLSGEVYLSQIEVDHLGYYKQASLVIKIFLKDFEQWFAGGGFFLVLAPHKIVLILKQDLGFSKRKSKKKKEKKNKWIRLFLF